MKPKIARGKYIAAVSGGVDSMVLLDLLSRQPGLELIVAHFNHGIRPDSVKDEGLVKAAAKNYDLAVEVGRGNLGSGASEEKARDARYRFLREVKSKYGASAIITAHHQDDVIETALINLSRGTGPRGLVSLADTPEIKRPLLAYTKKQIVAYAKSHSIVWREDATNADLNYLRNNLRNVIIPKMSATQRKTVLENIDKVAKNRNEQSRLLALLIHVIAPDKEIDRRLFSALPADVSAELLATWLRDNGFRDFDRKLITRLNVAIRTAPPNSRADVNAATLLKFDKQKAHLVTR